MADPLDPFVLVPVPDPMIGTVINGFVIIRLLGRGGMGAVYLAQHQAASHIRCVFKTILAHLSNNPVIISRFHTETDAVGRLSEHDNIVELRHFGVLPNGQMYMQFEFINGAPLDRFLAEWGGRLSLYRAIYIAFQICDALDYAHLIGVIHRDLKPDNVLIIVQDYKQIPRLVKIVDFGIAKVVRTREEQTVSGVRMGTPYFMSVEQYANAAEASAKSDVFSLAVILWLMITGELPWGRPEPATLYHLQCTVVPTPPPEDVMPAAVAKILLRCYSPNPDDRPPMAKLAIDLAAVVAATDDAPSGVAILKHIAPRFLMSSPDHARTLRNTVPANPDGVAAQLWPPINTNAAVAPALPSLDVDKNASPVAAAESVAAEPVTASGAPLSAPAHALESAPVADVTAQASPRAFVAPAHTPESPPSAPVAAVTAQTSPRTLAAPAALAPSAATTSPDGAAFALVAPASRTAESVPAASRPVAASPLSTTTSIAAPGVRNLHSPVLAALSTGLISQKHIAPEPSIDLLSAVPRVRSVVAASEIVLANGTPGPQPYAHAELPRVLVSNTLLSGAARTPDRHQYRPNPEPPPFVVLPDTARPRSHRKLVAIAAAVVALAVATSLALTWQGSKDADDRFVSSQSPGAVPGSFMVPINADAAKARSAVATDHPRMIDAGQLALDIDASTSTLDESRGPDVAAVSGADKRTEVMTSIIHSVSPIRPPEQAASDDPARVPAGEASPRPVPNTPPKPANQGTSPNHTPMAQASTSEATLVIRVKGFAAVSIDGDEPSASPRRKRVQGGMHHVVMTGYPDGSEDKKTKEFDVHVPAGKETIISKAW